MWIKKRFLEKINQALDCWISCDPDGIIPDFQDVESHGNGETIRRIKDLDAVLKNRLTALSEISEGQCKLTDRRDGTSTDLFFKQLNKLIKYHRDIVRMAELLSCGEFDQVRTFDGFHELGEHLNSMVERLDQNYKNSVEAIKSVNEIICRGGSYHTLPEEFGTGELVTEMNSVLLAFQTQIRDIERAKDDAGLKIQKLDDLLGLETSKLKVEKNRCRAIDQKLQQVMEHNDQLTQKIVDLGQTANELTTKQSDLQYEIKILKKKTGYLDGYNKELNKLNNDLIKSKNLLEGKNRSVVQAFQEKSDVVEHVIGEVQNPVKELVSTLAQWEDNTSQLPTEVIQNIDRISKNLTETLANIVHLSNKNLNHHKLELKEISLHDLIESLKAKTKILTGHIQYSLIVEMAEDLPKSLFTDQDRLLLILTHLLCHAIYIDQKRAVSCRVYRTKGDVLGNANLKTNNYIAFEILDQGAYCPFISRDETRNWLQDTDESVQLHMSLLGLTTLRSLAETLDGEIHYSNRQEKGNQYIFYFPIHASIPESAEKQPEHTITDHTTQHTYVIIEEDSNSARSYVESFSTAGIMTQVIDSIENALPLISEISPDCVVMGDQFSGMAPHELYRRLYSELSTCHIPLCAVSAMPLESLIEHGVVTCFTTPLSDASISQNHAAVTRYLDNDLRRYVVVHHTDIDKKMIEDSLLSIGGMPFFINDENIDHTKINEYLSGIIWFPDKEELDEDNHATTLAGINRNWPALPVLMCIDSREIASHLSNLQYQVERTVLCDGFSDFSFAESSALVSKLRHTPRAERKRKLQAYEQFKSTGLKGKNVLLISEDIPSTFGLRKILDLDGLNISSCSLENTATTIHANPPFHLVLVENQFNVQYLLEAIQLIKELEDVCHLPVLIVKTPQSSAERNFFLFHGADDILSGAAGNREINRLLNINLFFH